MSFIGRFFVILFAVMLASIAAGIAIAIGVLGPQWHVLNGDPAERVIFWGVAVLGSIFTGAIESCRSQSASLSAKHSKFVRS